MPVLRREPGALAARVEHVKIGLALADDHVNPGQLAELAELLRRELGLRRPAPPDHVHFAYLARDQGLEHRL